VKRTKISAVATSHPSVSFPARLQCLVFNGLLTGFLYGFPLYETFFLVTGLPTRRGVMLSKVLHPHPTLPQGANLQTPDGVWGRWWYWFWLL